MPIACRIYLSACWVKSFGENLRGNLFDVIMIDIKFLFVLYRLNWGKQRCDIRMHAITIQLILKFEIVKNMLAFFSVLHGKVICVCLFQESTVSTQRAWAEFMTSPTSAAWV